MAECLAEQSRERVVRSVLNNSKSKQMWTFPKKKRFNKIRPECPHAAYQSQVTTLNQHYPKFSNAPRQLFESQKQLPSPAHYTSPGTPKHHPVTFGESREKCAFSTYIRQDMLQNPAPTDYDKFAGDQHRKSRKGVSMRPRTANHYNYFIDDRERQQIPSPLQYDTSLQREGKPKISKYRSINMTGGTGPMSKSQRFITTQTSPGPSSYEPKKVCLRNSFHCPMNRTARASWLDRISQKELSPGPGDYQLPSEFGHYVKPRSRRLLTIE